MSQALVPYAGGSDLSQYLREISQYPILDRDQETELALRYRETGDLEAARKLVLSNLRFVVKVAMGYRKYGLPVMELVQEGNLGLMEAVRKFDPEKGYRLITYAVWWIRAYIQKHILDMWSIVRRGTTRAQRKLFYNLRKTANEMQQQAGRDMSADELAEALDVDTADVQAMQQMMSGADVSLDAQVAVGDDDEGVTYLDFLADSGDSQETVVIAEEERGKVAAVIQSLHNTLSERDRAILDRRLLADPPATLEELSRDYGISRERVRQLEDTLKKKIRGMLVGSVSPD